MVCFRYIIVNTLHKGDDDDDDNTNTNTNNNNNNNYYYYNVMKWVWVLFAEFYAMQNCCDWRLLCAEYDYFYKNNDSIH
jgi:hypothetical protein